MFRNIKIYLATYFLCGVFVSTKPEVVLATVLYSTSGNTSTYDYFLHNIYCIAIFDSNRLACRYLHLVYS